MLTSTVVLEILSYGLISDIIGSIVRIYGCTYYPKINLFQIIEPNKKSSKIKFPNKIKIIILIER